MHLDHVGLVHMGGRVYDPEIGRFLSPDPFVQFPASTQGFNRYAYVGNNPLSYTDPSGYFLKKLGKVVGIGMNFIPGFQLMGSAWIHGFVSGFLASGGNAKAGMMGMMSAGIAGQIGDIKGLGHFQRSALHGVTQGAISAAGGGRFGDGALGAFSGSFLSFIPEAVAGPYGTGGEGAKIGRMTAAAVVGGTASKIGGGKFANGAWSAAFVSRFNHDGGGDLFRTRTSASQIVVAPDEAATVFDYFYPRRQPPLLAEHIDYAGIKLANEMVVSAAHSQGIVDVVGYFTPNPAAGPVRLIDYLRGFATRLGLGQGSLPPQDHLRQKLRSLGLGTRSVTGASYKPQYEELRCNSIGC